MPVNIIIQLCIIVFSAIKISFELQAWLCIFTICVLIFHLNFPLVYYYFSVFINIVPPTVFNTLSEETYSKGEEVVISFNILQASPPVKLDDINWYFTGVQTGAQEIPLNISCAGINSTCEERYKRYNFSSDLTTLTISNTQVEDYGQFQIKAVNAAGDNSAVYNLFVQGQNLCLNIIIKWFGHLLYTVKINMLF